MFIKKKPQSNLIIIKKYQDFFYLSKIKKIKIKKSIQWKYQLKRFIVAKYFKTRILKKRITGFWLWKKKNCRGYYPFNKLHKRLAFKIPQVKYKKIQKSSLKQNAIKKMIFLTKRKFFTLTLKEPAIFEPRLIEIFRRTMSKMIKKTKKRYKTDAKWRCNVNPNQSSTRKGRGTRMGTGKGGIRTWIYKASIGQPLLSLKKTCVVRQPHTLLQKIKKIMPYKMSSNSLHEIKYWRKPFFLQRFLT